VIVLDRFKSLFIWVGLFVFTASVYYATAAGTTSSNDGSHYALLRAMIDEQRFEIKTYAEYAEGNDLAIRDEVIYSDRPPGTAISGIPFYVFGRILPKPINTLPSRHDEGNPALAYLVMLPVFAGAGTVVLLYQLLRSYDLSMFASLTAALSFALGTTIWKYGSVFYSHAVSAFLVTLAVYLTLRTVREGHLTKSIGLLLGLVLGLSVLVEYSNAILIVLVVLYLAIRLKQNLLVSWQSLVLAAGGGLIGVGFLMYYNTVNFGGPFTTSYNFAINYPWASSFASTFDVPLTQGLPAMLWYGKDALGEENQGLFLLMPITLVGIIGTWFYVKVQWQEAVLVVGCFLFQLVLFSMHHTFSGFTFDGRYLMPFISLLFVPIGFALDRILLDDNSLRRTLSLFIMYGLVYLSVRNMMAHIAFSYNYHLDPGLVMRRAATPQNWSYILSNIFVNWQNLPLLWGVIAALLIIYVVIVIITQRIQTQP